MGEEHGRSRRGRPRAGVARAATGWARSRSGCCSPAGPAPATSAPSAPGNIGATNVLRTGRKGLALATLLLDLAKGALPTALGYAWLGPIGAVLGGAGAIIGHCFPVWLGFRGGKGVATAAGVVLGLTPLLFLLILAGLRRRRLGHPLGVAGLDGRRLPGAGGRLAARRSAGPPGSTCWWRRWWSTSTARTSAGCSRARRTGSASAAKPRHDGQSIGQHRRPATRSRSAARPAGLHTSLPWVAR